LFAMKLALFCLLQVLLLVYAHSDPYGGQKMNKHPNHNHGGQKMHNHPKPSHHPKMNPHRSKPTPHKPKHGKS